MPDRDEIIERIHEAIDMGVCVDLFMDILELLKEESEAIKQKTGHWNGSECSNCHAIFVRSVFDKLEYCSHCGAKMERQ